jgi:HEAT repeat protein
VEAKKAIPELGKALKDPDRDVRVQAAQALGEMGPEAKPSFLALLNCARKDKRISCAKLLGSRYSGSPCHLK